MAQVPAWNSDCLVLKRAATVQNWHKKQMRQRIIRINFIFALCAVIHSLRWTFVQETTSDLFSINTSLKLNLLQDSGFRYTEQLCCRRRGPVQSQDQLQILEKLNRTHFLPCTLLKGLKGSQDVPRYVFTSSKNMVRSEFGCFFSFFANLIFKNGAQDSIVSTSTALAGITAWAHGKLPPWSQLCNCHKSSQNAIRSLYFAWLVNVGELEWELMFADAFPKTTSYSYYLISWFLRTVARRIIDEASWGNSSFTNWWRHLNIT